MATTTPKVNVKAFAAMLENSGQIGFKPPPSSSSSGPKTNGNKPAISPRQNETPKKINPPGVAAPFGRNTLNNRISVLKKTSNANEDATLSKNGETEIKIIAANKKPPIVPRTINSEAVKKPIVSPPASQSPMKNEAPVREQENAVKNDASDVVAKEDKDNLEGIQMKKKLVPINAKTNKRSSKIRPKENPVPPEGILGKAPAKPEKPPIILELKRDTSAPLPPPPDSDSEGELYDDVETDARVSMIKPMDEDEELETEDFYDDVEAEKIKPARKADPLPTLPVLPVSNLPPEPIDTEPDEVYQDVSDEGEEIGEDDDIYETFDEVTEKR
uniref:PHD finger protein rhinoceros-like n=1 Tax=Saccoglossus kowalevskii TaxID=10224 RepID=A0ABM0M0L0_SACKO